MRSWPVCSLLLALLLGVAARENARAAVQSRDFAAIASPSGASPMEVLAAREVRRYVYLRTGRWLPLVTVRDRLPRGPGLPIVVARRDRAVVRRLGSQAGLSGALGRLKGQGYLLRTLDRKGARALLVAGGDDLGTLYGAYRLAEHLGVRFYLHGDVVPDRRAAPRLAALNEVGAPLFPLRGIQPFHDFPEGPDWWNLAEYRMVVSQIPKLRMNFLGLHTYPEPIAEPTVWIGPSSDLDGGGRVRSGYPASYQNTLRGDWGYAAKRTGDFVFGASQLFESDAYGADVMKGHLPKPTTSEGGATVANRTAELLRQAFGYARRLGIKTCVGTETPLTIPGPVKERLKAQGKDPASPEAVQALYEGMFRRIAAAYPIDYYWFWTPEGWTWSGTTREQVEGTLRDLELARAAAQAVRAPFQLATCGWVLGPESDRSLFDAALPKSMPVSCINRQVGMEPVDPAFARVKGREKWAIPWLEDDPALTSPQLWVGRMRRDAADALRYGCTGLMGIHWRTRNVGPNVSALAQAAWTQKPWSSRPVEGSGPVGGSPAAFPSNPIEGTDDPTVYRTVRYGLSAYHLAVPRGTYRVTLKFCEPHYDRAGARAFDVKLQGKPVLESLDIFARVGKNRALDYSYDNVRVPDGRLSIEFAPRVEYPSIAAILVEGPGYRKAVNCGGPAHGVYEADPAPASDHLATGDFYRDWAAAQFGPEVGPRAAAIFERVDGRLPRPSDWVNGPGGLRPDDRPWQQVREEYRFVSELAQLRPQVRGAGSRARMDYWVDTFRYMEAMARLRCDWAALNGALARAKAAGEPAERGRLARRLALPLRERVVRQVGTVYSYLLRTVSTTGEMGTVANWEQHILPDVLDKTGQELEALLGEPLPLSARPSTAYRGPARVIVPSPVSNLVQGEAMDLRVILLAGGKPRSSSLAYRPLGGQRFRRLPLRSVARGVYRASVPAGSIGPEGIEYFVEARTAEGQPVRWPAAAPTLCQTVVVMPR